MLPLARLLRGLSEILVTIDRWLMTLLIGMVAVLVLANAGARAAGYTVAWADELAIRSMILAAFLAAALLFRMRRDPSVQILQDFVPSGVARALRIVASLAGLTFAVVLLWLCWRWFDPLAFAAAGFDVRAFQMATGNFIYSDTTPVMGVPSTLFFVVVPWFAFTMTVHALANLIEDAGILPARRAGPGEAVTA